MGDKITIAGAGLLLALACAACSEPEASALRIEVPAGVGEHVVTYAEPGGVVHELICGGAPASTGPARCADGVIEVPRGDGELTVKAFGYAHWTRALGAAPDSQIAGLVPLATAEVTPDYTTGFGPDGRANFDEMAFEFDTELGPSRVVKFYIDDLHGVDGEPTVYFQNTRKHALHYPFYRDVLGGTDTLSQFEKATYHGAERTAMAGTVLLYPDLVTEAASVGGELRAPMILTFFPSDDLTVALARRAHRLIEERVHFLRRSGGQDRLCYLPAGASQEAQLAEKKAQLLAHGAAFAFRTELFGHLEVQLLNEGVAFGTLRRLTPEELESTVVSFGDVLVLTRLPNLLPIVGGTITEELQTPLAHVNVAARTRGTPNLALLGAGAHPDIQPLLGELVRFEVTGSGWTIREATVEEAKAFWESKQNKEPFVPEADIESAGLPGFGELGFHDASRVGVKAANLAELSNLLGDRAPRGFAIPFHYYDAFMKTANATPALCAKARADCVTEGRDAAVCDRAATLCTGPGGPETLSDHVARLIADGELQVDTTLREASLNSVRYLIGHLPVDPAFGAALDARIEEVFGAGKARLRSSTNAEDLPNFSGAGLYASKSAYATGPKAASLRVRKVWASVWSWRAFEERAFWNIDHLAVQMGVAVNQAFPDEAANGVLITQNIADPTVAGMYVNVQLGETPVTNPEDGAVAEVFSIIAGPIGVQVARQRFSSLSPEAPILAGAEVYALYQAADEVQFHFAPLYDASPYGLALDLEFKFHGPERALFIKQVRPYTQAPTTGSQEIPE